MSRMHFRRRRQGDCAQTINKRGLVALCDQLEASLTASAATRRRLLDALLAEGLAPADDRKREAAE